MPTSHELIAHGRTDEEVARIIGADDLVYQDIDSMKGAISDMNTALTDFEASCFDGRYITGDVTPELLERVEALRAGA